MNLAQTIPLAQTWDMHGDVGWGWMALMMVAMVLFWGAIIVGIAWLIRGAVWGSSAPAQERVEAQNALEILERRFAEGAISVEDYRERRAVLVNEAAPPNDARDEDLLTAARQEEGSRR